MTPFVVQIKADAANIEPPIHSLPIYLEHKPEIEAAHQLTPTRGTRHK